MPETVGFLAVISMTIEQIILTLTQIDPSWSLSCQSWQDSITCHLTVNGVTRSHVGTLGTTDYQMYEDALRNAARMFGVPPRIIAVGRCSGGSAFQVTTPPADWPSADEIAAICARNARIDKFALAIRALMDAEDVELYLGFA